MTKTIGDRPFSNRFALFVIVGMMAAFFVHLLLEIPMVQRILSISFPHFTPL